MASDAEGGGEADRLFKRRSGGDEKTFHATSIARVDALRQVEAWPAPYVVVRVIRSARGLATHGPRERVFRWASVTKLVTALVALVAAEEGTIDLDEPAGPEGSTVRHLLAHASGLPFEAGGPVSRPGWRRVYSNPGFEALAEHVAQRAEMPFTD